MSHVKYRVVNSEGLEVGSVDLDPEVFDCEVSASLVHRVVVWQLAKRRQGTHSTKTRAEVSGGGKKPWKQKGRGTARSGSNTSPVWVGGGRAHGPKPRDYTTRLNKQVRRKAIAGILTEKVRGEQLVVFDDIRCAEGRTKEFFSLLKNVRCEQYAQKGGVLVVLPEKDELVWRSLRNLPEVEALPVAGVNAHDLLRKKVIISTPAGLETLTKRVKGITEDVATVGA